jgi:capsid protein
MNKYNTWVVGNGLKLQSEPNKTVLGQEGYELNEDFTNSAEERFKIWSKSRWSDHARMWSLNKLASEAHKHAKIGGDILCVMRIVKGRVTLQLIDGAHVMTPFHNSSEERAALARGNTIKHGVELSPTGEHIAYYVLGLDNKFYRVQRIGAKSGRLMAFLVYGNKYRIDEVRGMPLVSAVLESLRKLDRYKEATVGSAEERQKIAYSVEHGTNSTGENPLLEKLVQAKKLGMGEAPETKSEEEYETAATKVAATTGKMAFNMPVDSQLKLLESKNELYFKDFYDTNFNGVSSALQIPPEVARSMYNSNYSASRAAIKDWEHSLLTQRQDFSDQYYQNYYNLWLDIEVLQGKLSAKGYVQALSTKNIMAIEAYRNARWLGANVPHIDPLKEVLAERKKLGDDTTPLGSYEQAAENLNTGDWRQNMKKVEEERKLIPKPINQEQ